MPSPLARLLLGPCILALSSQALAQVTWREVPPSAMTPMGGHAMAWHAGSGRVVLIGGLFAPETWLWDGVRWARAQPTATPNVGSGHALVYDSARDCVVLVGGGGGSTAWEWNGSDWSQSPVPGAPTLTNHAMAYHAGLGVTLHFGGALLVPVADTRTYDGTAWALLPGPNPAARSGHAMAYDAVRGEVVMYGGSDSTFTRRTDTWTWNGTWTQRQVAGPGPLDEVALVWDPVRERVVLHGSTQGGANPGVAVTWEWDGVAWASVSTRLDPGPRTLPAASWDGNTNSMLLQGGMISLIQYWQDTWSYDGVEWSLLESPESPPIDPGMTMAYDLGRGEALLLTSGPRTWISSGSAWREVSSGSLPDRTEAHIGYQPSSGGLVLYGGRAGTQALADTWIWDGNQWLSGSAGPPARTRARVAYDQPRDELLLFGGRDAGGDLDETWSFNSVSGWSQLQPANRPSPRSSHAMAWDFRRNRIVLFGGLAGSTALNDTWEWDGTDWAQVAAAGPPAREAAQLVYDPLRERTVLFHGYNGTAAQADTWEWDGSVWIQRVPLLAPDPTHRYAAVYHLGVPGVLARVGPTLGFPGQDSDWVYGPTRPAEILPFGSSCTGGTAGGAGPRLHSNPNTAPWLGDTFELRLSQIAGQGLGWLGVGPTATQWNGTPLPVPLGRFGIPGCSLLIAPDAVVSFQWAAASVDIPLTVPNDPTLAGLSFQAQALVAQSSGFAVTGGVEIRIGSR